MKIVANEIFGVFRRYQEGICTYDRALEDASKIIDKYADEQPIVGYVKSNTLRKVLFEVIENKKPNSEKPYIFDCKVHKNEMDVIIRIFESLKP